MADYGFVKAIRAKVGDVKGLRRERTDVLRELMLEVPSGKVTIRIGLGSLIVEAQPAQGVGPQNTRHLFTFQVEGCEGVFGPMEKREAIRTVENLSTPASNFIGFLGHSDAEDITVEVG